jgi:hypothetical protein
MAPPVAGKISRIEERHHDQSYLIMARRLQKQSPEHRKSILYSSPGEDGLCSSENKHNTQTAPRPKLFISENRLHKKKATAPKTVLSSSPDEDVSVALKLSMVK